MGRQQIGEDVLGGTSEACHLCRDVDFYVAAGWYVQSTSNLKWQILVYGSPCNSRNIPEIYVHVSSHIVPLMTFAAAFFGNLQCRSIWIFWWRGVTSSITHASMMCKCLGVNCEAYVAEYHLLFNPLKWKLMYSNITHENLSVKLCGSEMLQVSHETYLDNCMGSEIYDRAITRSVCAFNQKSNHLIADLFYDSQLFFK